MPKDKWDGAEKLSIQFVHCNTYFRTCSGKCESTESTGNILYIAGIEMESF